MTNLNQEQVDSLQVVASEKAKYDAAKAELAAQYARDSTNIQLGLRVAVRASYDLGVPTRRIALDGMGTAGTDAVKALLGLSAPRKAPQKAEKVEPKRILTAPAVQSLDDGVFVVTEPSGREWEFWGVDIGGSILMERSDSTGRGVDSDVPAPAAVIEAMKTRLPRADYSAIRQED